MGALAQSCLLHNMRFYVIEQDLTGMENLFFMRRLFSMHVFVNRPNVVVFSIAVLCNNGWRETLPCPEVKELVLADRKLRKVCESSISC